jgi:hypothetical protein
VRYICDFLAKYFSNVLLRMLKPVICCLSVFGLILLVGWILGLIMIHLFEKKLKARKPSSVVVHISDKKLKPNTYSINKVKRERRARPKRVEGFTSGKRNDRHTSSKSNDRHKSSDCHQCSDNHRCSHHHKAIQIKQRVTPPATVTNKPDKEITENFDPFIGKYRRQSRRAERTFVKHHGNSRLSGFNIKEYDGTTATITPP